MKALYLILCLLLLAACRNTPPGAEVKILPPELGHLPPGTVLDFGDGYRSTVLPEKKILHERPAQQATRKCKNCGNTYYEDNSKEKHTGDTKLKDQHREDNSSWKDAKPDFRQDNRVNPPPDDTVGFIGTLQKIFTWVAVAAAVIVGLALLFKFV